MKNSLFVVAIFLGSFVSFALEPMIGRALLPVFGGTPMVWVTCLGAFQILMVGGYFYGAMKKAEEGTAGLKWHVVLLGLVGLWCCALSFVSESVIFAAASLTGVGPIDVLIAVLALIGFAFVLLSANATIVQNLSGGDYRLYAVSNLGSLLGLFAYPLLIEPFVGLSAQWLMLGGGILLYAVVLLAAAKRRCEARCKAPDTAASPDDRRQAPTSHVLAVSRPFLYLALPAVSCGLLNSLTTHLTLDIAPLPLLWAALLGIFLVSYIIGFSGWGRSIWWAVPAAVSAIVAYWWVVIEENNSVFDQLALSAALLLFVSTFIHSWLYELRPGKEQLGRYYLLNVIGGAAGGTITSIVAPLVFPSVVEYPVFLWAGAISVIAWSFARFAKPVAFGTLVVLVVGFASAHFRESDVNKRNARIIHRSRGFFGTIRVNEITASSSDGQPVRIHEFYHGETVHGIEVMRKEMEKMPTCYYTPYSSGFAIWGHHKYRDGKPMRVQMVGLGIGVLFAYSRPGDYYHAYEISKETIDVATNPEYFAFVPHSPAKVELSLCDARKGLEKELADGVEPYDVIVVDAFTGDNLPYHLSTKEAFEIYFRLLKPDGVLCINFTNKHLDLRPYIKRVGMEFGIEPITLSSFVDEKRIAFATDVAFFTRHPEKLRELPIADGHAAKADLSSVKPLPEMPTDDKGSFLPLIKFR